MSITVRIAGIVRESIVDGNGIRFVVFTQGCPHACNGCHNPQSHDSSGGYDCDIEKIFTEIMKNPLLSGVTFSGGEPLIQVKPLLELAKKIREVGLGLIIYTGFLFEDLMEMMQKDCELYQLIALCDVVVDGKFEEDQKDLTLRFRGSANQRVINVAQTLKQNQIVLTEF